MCVCVRVCVGRMGLGVGRAAEEVRGGRGGGRGGGGRVVRPGNECDVVFYVLLYI